jgi:beta-N-acetylhexosaminidase
MAEASSPEDAASTFGDYAGRMAGLGLNMNLGPAADVGTGAGLANRTFGDDPDTVLSYASAISAAVRAAGVVPVPKHWPGIGSGDVDPHQGATTVDDIETLRSGDLRVFDGLFDAGVPAVMVSHALIPGLTDDRPASLSAAAITDELRGRQGFSGVVITDSLGMGAVSAKFDNPRAALESIVAGADIALLSGVAFVEAATALLVTAVSDGTLPMEQLDASVDRILRLKGITGPCPLPDAA